jgi:homoprotocatechuate degradation regulator HpaR
MSNRNVRVIRQKRPAAGPVGQRNLPLLMLRGREAVLQHFRPVFNRFDLTEQQWRILRFLSDEGEVEQRLLARRCQILGPSLTNILSRLEELDYVGRRRSADDQRRVYVVLTTKGRRLIAAVAPFIAEQYRVIEARIGAGMMKELIAVLDRLLDVFEPEHAAEDDGGT